ncbi:MAG: alanine:cation symporter family protein [Bacteroidia bacterium]|nr:alanine:cation symporter family protein [Bacteroidia bacterium]MBT8269802.1 alanine:cation symporter family protein [Bacteroidia bacterium]NNF82663.1 alanine:cation symporter family protein [Flavobacteriaceae bacterium]NNK70867.1 alanine:cation symporter family protein [Flavobacteriaceae bacterium]NNL80403.1 alanine:cation symporter family protein [Flavobacteriaceae bacterium]
MKKYLLLFFSALLPMFSQAQEASRGLDERVNDAFMPIADAWEGLVLYPVSIAGFDIPIVVILLVVGATFFTLTFKFPNIMKFPLAINTVRGKYDDIEQHGVAEKVAVNIVEGDLPDTIRDESKEGEVSHFQALATAVSGTVGLGNIAGVAIAIALGGPGATFWMIVCGLIGMSTKFVECTLGVTYRDVGEDGTVYGGPMYYLSKGLKERKMAGLGKVLAVLFAILCIGASFGGGNAFQSNQATVQLSSLLGLEGGSTGFIIGIILAVLVGIVIIGGIKRIASITEKIVPFMAGIYVLAALIIIFANFSYIDDAFGLIIEGAFTPMAGLGGLVGVLIVGFQRAAFSNEAGAGSAAIAHSAVKTRYPASEGVVALLEPFIDTVVICTMTALVIIFFNIDGDNVQSIFQYGAAGDSASSVLLNSDGSTVGGVDLTSMAFDSVIPGFSYVLTIAIVLFAFSTMISWSYYGLQSWKYLFGKGKTADMLYKLLFLIFVVIGAAATLDAVIKFSDAMILALVFPNMIGLLLLFPKVRQEVTRYLEAIRASRE